MRHGVCSLGIAALCLAFAGSVHAQEIVHALSGTVEKVDPQSRTIQVRTNDGSEGTFSFPKPNGTQKCL